MFLLDSGIPMYLVDPSVPCNLVDLEIPSVHSGPWYAW